MHEPDDVVVQVTPVQARHLAGALRCELAMRWEAAELGPVPCREEIQRVRALLDDYGDRLERLDWGEPAGELRVSWRADAVSGLVRELRQAAQECFADARCDDDDAQEMLDTAQVLADALLATPQMAAAT
jgi:hypothetical protein